MTEPWGMKVCVLLQDRDLETGEYLYRPVAVHLDSVEEAEKAMIAWRANTPGKEAVFHVGLYQTYLTGPGARALLPDAPATPAVCMGLVPEPTETAEDLPDEQEDEEEEEQLAAPPPAPQPVTLPSPPTPPVVESNTPSAPPPAVPQPSTAGGYDWDEWNA